MVFATLVTLSLYNAIGNFTHCEQGVLLLTDVWKYLQCKTKA